MEAGKSKSLKNIEERMQGLEDKDSLRYHILESVKKFKTSWIELGQALYTVHRDKLYKDWGYQDFQAYTAKEIGIKKQTAIKLLRSYYFLEQEEPGYLKEDYLQAAGPEILPSYESIDILRLAKNKKSLDSHDYFNLKKAVFQNGQDPKETRKDLAVLIRQRQELDPEELRRKRKISTVKRFLSTLKSLKKELETLKLVSQPILKEAADLIRQLEAEIA